MRYLLDATAQRGSSVPLFFSTTPICSWRRRGQQNSSNKPNSAKLEDDGEFGKQSAALPSAAVPHAEQYLCVQRQCWELIYIPWREGQRGPVVPGWRRQKYHEIDEVDAAGPAVQFNRIFGEAHVTTKQECAS